MRTVFEPRASSVLFNVLRSQEDERPFLLPSNVCPIVPITFLQAGRRVCFVDINQSDLVMDRERCIDILSGATEPFAGVLFVRTYGVSLDENAFFGEIKRVRPDVLIIDDKCLCRPELEGACTPSSADVTLFSTGRGKYVDIGFGGFAYLNEQVRYRRHSGGYSASSLVAVTRRYRAAIASLTPFSFDEGDENWLDLSSPAIPADVYFQRAVAARSAADQHKSALNAIYESALPEDVQLQPKFQHWRFNIRVAKAHHLVARLFESGLFASRHYPPVTGAFSEEHFPNAQRLHNQIVNLFNDRNYDVSKALRTAEIVLEHLDAG